MSIDTMLKIKNWRKIYELSSFTNKNFCNPEINFLSCLKDLEDLALPNILKGKKICCITSCFDVFDKLLRYDDITYIKIQGQNDEHYRGSFCKVVEIITETATNYDIWLVAGGELGRIYIGIIKYKGGIAFDAGSLIDYWGNELIPARLKPFIKKNKDDNLFLDLTIEGNNYRDFIFKDTWRC